MASLLLVWLISGCGGGESLMNISGNVTFDGSPLPYGEILFIPDNAAGDGGGAGFARIENGKYDTATEGRGIHGGKYQLRVTGYAAKPAAGSEDETVTSETEQEAPLFHGYTTGAEITSATHDVVIPADAKGFNGGDAAATRAANEP